MAIIADSAWRNFGPFLIFSHSDSQPKPCFWPDLHIRFLEASRRPGSKDGQPIKEPEHLPFSIRHLVKKVQQNPESFASYYFPIHLKQR